MGIRNRAGSAALGFAKLVLTTMIMLLIMIGVMFLMRFMMGGGNTFGGIRGEFGMFIFSGVAMFQTHNQIFKAVSGSWRPDPMLPVLNVSKAVATIGGVLETVYMSLIVNVIFYIIICIYYGRVILDEPLGLMYCYLLLIIWSMSLGLIFQSIAPLSPTFVPMIANLYMRMGIVTSGKMVPGNQLAIMGKFGGIFMINPLFHLIDQARGYIFEQYHPFVSNLSYPIKMTIVFFLISMIFGYVSSKIG